MPIVSGGTPATAQLTSRANGDSPSSRARSAEVTMQTAAPSFWPLALPAVTVASGSLATHHRPELGQALQARVGARVLVAVDQPGAAAAIGSPLPGRSPRRSPRARAPRRLAGASAGPARPAAPRGIPYSRRTFSAVSSMPPGTGWCLPPAFERELARRSTSIAPPDLAPQRSEVEYSSTPLMLSAPPARTRSAAPV